MSPDLSPQESGDKWGELGGHRGTSRRGFDAGRARRKMAGVDGPRLIEPTGRLYISMHQSCAISLGKLAPLRRGLLFARRDPPLDSQMHFRATFTQEPQA